MLGEVPPCPHPCHAQLPKPSQAVSLVVFAGKLKCLVLEED